MHDVICTQNKSRHKKGGDNFKKSDFTHLALNQGKTAKLKIARLRKLQKKENANIQKLPKEV